MPTALKDFFYIFGLVSYGFLFLTIIIITFWSLFRKLKRVIKNWRKKWNI